MKPTALRFILAAILLWQAVSTAFGQGTFQNLDFESATLVPIPGDTFGRVRFSPAFPGWVGYLGADPQTVADHNNRSLSQPGIAIMGPDFPSPNLFQGRFYARLYATDGPQVSAALAQTGSIPSNANSLRFYGSPSILIGPFATLSVSFAGQPISLSVLDSNNSYYVYGGDVSGFAGQTGELRFAGFAQFDNITFSNQPIPEPSAFGLFGFCALLLGVYSCRLAKR